MTGTVAAVDLGATSGRVMLGRVGPNELAIRTIARFANGAIEKQDGLYWDFENIWEKVCGGLASAFSAESQLRGIGVDSWAVDYGLLCNERLLQPPHHYRDPRNNAAVDIVHAEISADELYRTSGLQHLPFNTIFQLVADRLSGALDEAQGLLLIPDLINYMLTGCQYAEQTNASTTGLLALDGANWNADFIQRLSLPSELFPDLICAGEPVGGLLSNVAAILGASSHVTVTAVGSHDTSSAVVAVPSVANDFAYISCGTWGLVGVELESPILTKASENANFTNERGVDGRVRYLHNVMGLWLLSESMREWQRTDVSIELTTLISAAAAVTRSVAIFDVNDPVFLLPGDMPSRIAAWCRNHDQPVPRSRAELVRSIIESLSAAFVQAVQDAAMLSGKRVSVIHIVGGGSQNALLCQRIADRARMPVIAGPVEATAIGNVLVQARATGLASGSLESLRAVVAQAVHVIAYQPSNFGPEQ